MFRKKYVCKDVVTIVKEENFQDLKQFREVAFDRSNALGLNHALNSLLGYK